MKSPRTSTTRWFCCSSWEMMSQKTQRSFCLEVVAAGAQFIEHAARNKRGRGELRSGMLEFLPGIDSVILEDADVLEARIALEVLNALRRQQQELLDLGVAGVPQLAVVTQGSPPAPRARPPSACDRRCRRRGASGSPSMRYSGAGCTTARADQGPPSIPGMLETSCAGRRRVRHKSGRRLPRGERCREHRRR